jgi:hypothetical protein
MNVRDAEKMKPVIEALEKITHLYADLIKLSSGGAFNPEQDADVLEARRLIAAYKRDVVGEEK